MWEAATLCVTWDMAHTEVCLIVFADMLALPCYCTIFNFDLCKILHYSNESSASYTHTDYRRKEDYSISIKCSKP